MAPPQIGIYNGLELQILLLLLVGIPFLLTYLAYTVADHRGSDNAPVWVLSVGLLAFLTLFAGWWASTVYLPGA